MDSYPPEIATPPLALVALLGDPEYTSPVAEYLRSSHRPPCNSVSAADPLAGATELFGCDVRREDDNKGEEGEEEEASSSTSPSSGIFKSSWFAKHRQRVPAVAALFLKRSDVTGDPSAWASVMQAIDVVRASCSAAAAAAAAASSSSSSLSSSGGRKRKATPARLVLVVCGSVTGDDGSNVPPPLPEDRMAGLCRQGCLPSNSNNEGMATATAATATTAPSPSSSTSNPPPLPWVLVYSPQAEGVSGTRRIARLLHEHARAFYAEDAAARKKSIAAVSAAAASTSSSSQQSVVVAAASLAGSSSSSSLSALAAAANNNGAPPSRPLSPVALSRASLAPPLPHPSSAAALSAAREIKAGALAEFRGDWRGAEGRYKAAHESLAAAAASAERELEEEEEEKDAPASPPPTTNNASNSSTSTPPPPPQLPPSYRRQTLAEIAAVAEIAHLKRATLLLHQRRRKEAASAFAAHLRAFKNAAGGGISGSKQGRQRGSRRPQQRNRHPGALAAAQSWLERQHAAFADLLSLPVDAAAAGAAAAVAGGSVGSTPSFSSSAARARHLVAAARAAVARAEAAADAAKLLNSSSSLPHPPLPFDASAVVPGAYWGQVVLEEEEEEPSTSGTRQRRRGRRRRRRLNDEEWLRWLDASAAALPGDSPRGALEAARAAVVGGPSPTGPSPRREGAALSMLSGRAAVAAGEASSSAATELLAAAAAFRRDGWQVPLAAALLALRDAVGKRAAGEGDGSSSTDALLHAAASLEAASLERALDPARRSALAAAAAAALASLPPALPPKAEAEGQSAAAAAALLRVVPASFTSSSSLPSPSPFTSPLAFPGLSSALSLSAGFFAPRSASQASPASASKEEENNNANKTCPPPFLLSFFNHLPVELCFERVEVEATDGAGKRRVVGVSSSPLAPVAVALPSACWTPRLSAEAWSPAATPGVTSVVAVRVWLGPGSALEWRREDWEKGSKEEATTRRPSLDGEEERKGVGDDDGGDDKEEEEEDGETSMPLVLGRAPAGLAPPRPFGAQGPRGGAGGRSSRRRKPACLWSVDVDPPGGRPPLALLCPAQPLLAGEEVGVRAVVGSGGGGGSGAAVAFEGSGCSVFVAETSFPTSDPSCSAATILLPKPGRASLRATLRYLSGGGSDQAATSTSTPQLPLLLTVSVSAKLRAVAPFSLASAAAASKPGFAALHSPRDVAAAIKAAATTAAGAAAADSSHSPPLLPAGEPCVLSYTLRSEAPCALVVESLELVDLPERLELVGAATGGGGVEGKPRVATTTLLLPGKKHVALFVVRSKRVFSSSSSPEEISASPPGKLSVRWRRAEPAVLVAVGGGGASALPPATSTTTLLPLPAVAFSVPLLTVKLAWNSEKPIYAGQVLRLHLSVAATDPEKAAGARLRLDVGDAHGFVVAAAPRRGALPPLLPSVSPSSSSSTSTTTSTFVDVVPHAAGVLALPPVRLTVESCGGGGGWGGHGQGGGATAAAAAGEGAKYHPTSSSQLAVELNGASLDATAGLSVVVEPAMVL